MTSDTRISSAASLYVDVSRMCYLFSLLSDHVLVSSTRTYIQKTLTRSLCSSNLRARDDMSAILLPCTIVRDDMRPAPLLCRIASANAMYDGDKDDSVRAAKPDHQDRDSYKCYYTHIDTKLSSESEKRDTFGNRTLRMRRDHLYVFGAIVATGLTHNSLASLASDMAFAHTGVGTTVTSTRNQDTTSCLYSSHNKHDHSKHDQKLDSHTAPRLQDDQHAPTANEWICSRERDKGEPPKVSPPNPLCDWLAIEANHAHARTYGHETGTLDLRKRQRLKADAPLVKTNESPSHYQVRMLH